MEAKNIIVEDELSFRAVAPDSNEPNAAMLHRGEYPPVLKPLIGALRRTISRPARVLDLGAYMGGFGLAAAALGHEVVMVEASNENAGWIRQSLAANTFAIAPKLVQAAVGPTDGTVRFCSDGPWGHVETVTAPSSTAGAVRQLTLPSIMREVGWTAPDFIKMDVEGSEVRVIKSAEPWFREGHRPTLLYEANGHTLAWFGASPSELRALFAALGYTQYEVDDNGDFRHPDRFEPWCVMDYLATPQPLPGILPQRPAMEVLRRTVVALRSPSQPARSYAWKVLRRAAFGG